MNIIRNSTLPPTLHKDAMRLKTLPPEAALPADTPHASNQKACLRERMACQRKSLAGEQHTYLSLLAANRLMATPLWHNAQTVALYVALHGETNTAPLLEAAWQQAKQVFLPRCGAKGAMEFALCKSGAMLVRGAYGILEPCRERCRTILHPPFADHASETLHPLLPQPCHTSCTAKTTNTTQELPAGCRNHDPLPLLFIVPGLAFDDNGYRLGMGGGYYDRFLPLFATHNTAFIGFSFDFQRVHDLPHEPWDVPMTGLCTNKEFLWMHP